jgi:hypothetical protein
MAEAYLGIGDEDRSAQIMDRAREVAPVPWMVASTDEQIKRLAELQTQSPLRSLPGGGNAAESAR